MNAVIAALCLAFTIHIAHCNDCPATTTYNVYQAFGADADPGEKAAIFAKAGEVCDCSSSKIKDLEERLLTVESLVNLLLGGDNNENPAARANPAARVPHNTMLKDDETGNTGFPSNFGEAGGYNSEYEACPGLVYQDSTSQDIKFTCFYVVEDSAPVNFEGAQTACQSSSQSHRPILAAIKTKTSFDAVVAYLRDNLLQTRSIAHVWLGGDYDPTEGGDHMTWHDGVRTEETGVWYPHFPYTVTSHGEKYSSWRKLSLIVRGQVDFSGISNRAEGDAFLPLCQYEIRI